jgi:hypothetical protein
LWIVLCASIFFAIPLQAGPLDLDEVSAKAKWAAHLDLEGLFSSRIGGLFKDALEEEGAMAKIDAFGTIFEFNILEDLHSITAYGTSFEKEEAVGIFKGRFDEKKILALMGIEGTCRDFKHRGHTIHEWKDSHERFYINFLDSDGVMVSNSEELMKEAVEVLDGEQDSLDDRDGLKGLRSLPRHAFLAAAAQDFSKLAGCGDEPQAAMLKKAQEVRVVIGESEGMNYLDVTLATKDRETSQQVHDIVKGLIALGTIFSQDEPELAWLVEHAEVERDGRLVSIREAVPSDKLMKMLKDSMH